jgi:hypothetical protein
VIPFTFKDPAKDWARFCAAADAWKPEGYDAEMARRLAYYLDDQEPELRAEMRRRFPETHTTMTPVTVPLVRLLTQEQAKVFLSTTKLDLVEEGKEKPDEKLVAWWEKTKERMGLGLRLKRADCYTTLLRTAGLRIGYSDGRYSAHVVFPQTVKVASHPDAPMDLDRAYGVAVEIASDSGLQGGARRWEYWCARGGEELHLILEIGQDGDGKQTVSVVQTDTGDPLQRSDGKSIVPLVLFSAHTEELGLFATEGKGLVPANLGLNVLVTDIHHIAEQQGFGVMVVSSPAGEDAPPKLVRAPNTAISLKGGTTATFINPGAPLAELVQLADTRIKQAAVFRGLPAGAVSIEARAVASGIALQIEMRPLLEQRSDAIEVYREPMRRLWEVVRATHNAYRAKEDDGLDGEIKPTVSLRWTPGEIQAPVDDQVRVDSALAKMKARLQSRIETIAELRGISLEEAKKVAAAIDEEDPPKPDPVLDPDDPLGLAARKKQLQEEPAVEEEEEPPVAAEA